jgi:hypothetical protein
MKGGAIAILIYLEWAGIFLGKITIKNFFWSPTDEAAILDRHKIILGNDAHIDFYNVDLP